MHRVSVAHLESLSKRRSVSMVGGAARAGDGGASAAGVPRVQLARCDTAWFLTLSLLLLPLPCLTRPPS